MASPKPPSANSSHVAMNRKARRDYEILERFEAGIALCGTEVKSIRQGQISIDEGYAAIVGDEVFLQGVHILPYECGNIHNHDPRRPRRLLLHRREIKRLIGCINQKGQALIPLRVYFKRGKVKVELGLGKGKLKSDRRESLKKRTADREADRAMAAHRRR